ncbi:hypothetical protein K1T71_005368, partial [Dendrolimus kikuchii]
LHGNRNPIFPHHAARPDNRERITRALRTKRAQINLRSARAQKSHHTSQIE